MFTLARRTFSGHHIQNFSISCVCLIYHAGLLQNWRRGLPKAGKEGVGNKAVLTDFDLVWILADYGYYILDGLFVLEKLFIWRDFGLDLWNLDWTLFVKVLNWICIIFINPLFGSHAPYSCLIISAPTVVMDPVLAS